MEYFKERWEMNEQNTIEPIAKCECVNKTICQGTLYTGDKVHNYGGKEWCDPCFQALGREDFWEKYEDFEPSCQHEYYEGVGEIESKVCISCGEITR